MRSQGAVLYAGRVSWPEMPIQRPDGPGWMLTFTIAGRAVYEGSAATRFYAPAGDLVLLGAGTETGRGVPRGDHWDAFYLRFEARRGWRPQGFERVADRLYRTTVVLPGNRHRVHEAWERIIADLDSLETARVLEDVATGHAWQRGTDAQIETELILLRLREIFLLVLRDSYAAPHLDVRIREVVQAMERDLASPLDIRELAARAGLSYSWFAHLFKSQLGASPKQVQRMIRLRRAAVHLEYGDDTVGAIARRTGFGSIFDFSRAFHREYGVSPTAYRAQHR